MRKKERKFPRRLGRAKAKGSEALAWKPLAASLPQPSPVPRASPAPAQAPEPSKAQPQQSTQPGSPKPGPPRRKPARKGRNERGRSRRRGLPEIGLGGPWRNQRRKREAVCKAEQSAEGRRAERPGGRRPRARREPCGGPRRRPCLPESLCPR